MTSIESDAPQGLFDRAPMHRLQRGVIALTIMLSALDGYDVLSVTFAAPAITLGWGIGKAALGAVLSAGLAGMALGSFFLAPLADVFGRRRMVLVSLTLMGLGTLLSASAQSLAMLSAWRVVTGLGIGTCVAVINPLAAEFSNARWRPLALAAMAMGYPAGGLFGGLLSTLLLKSFGWQAIFLAGFGFAAILFVVVLLILPESISFLATRQAPDDLDRANALLSRCGHPTLRAFPPRPEARARGYAALFSGAEAKRTFLLAGVNGVNAAVAYYVLSWLPQMVGDAGFNPATASLVAAVSNLAGIAGGLLLGFVAQRAGIVRSTSFVVAGLGFATLAFGHVPPFFPALVLAAALCGFFLFASAAAFAALLAASFAAEERASGVGFVIGVGRISSAIAPLAAGWLFAAGLGRGTVSASFGIAAVLAALMLFAALRPTMSSTEGS
ncbi:MAG: MFS transporter [Sphingomonas sp.]|uniref:MFS transporter n=1 Tax=Sphingomonas sp. TaxID=28214 RepID=UPI001AD3E308|nr:MFS transporter [Sphingomonas sp.]MBN8814317.1 MFS transporter [Sphingomonas sp.]